MFSFDATAGASQSTIKNKLAGNAIHEVQLDGAEIQDIVGVKDPSQTYKVLKLKFSNEDGYYEHTVFEPKPGDEKRTENEFVNKNGNKEKIPQASPIESMMLMFKHIIDAFVPEVGAMIDRKEKTLGAKNWEELRKLVVAILDKGKGRTSTIKLVKNKNGEAVFPGFFAGVSREGVAYVRNNFIGKKVAFTSWEMDKINKEATAKPTPMNSGFDLNMGSEASLPDTSLNLDFDLDLAGL